MLPFADVNGVGSVRENIPNNVNLQTTVKRLEQHDKQGTNVN